MVHVAISSILVVEGIKLHIVAHSLGCQALLSGLELHDQSKLLGTIGEVFLVAPIVPSMELRIKMQDFVGKKFSDGFTVYCADDDHALRTAEALHISLAQNSFCSRDPLPGVVIVHWDNVVKLKIGKKLSHYYIKDPRLLFDMLVTINMTTSNAGDAVTTRERLAARGLVKITGGIYALAFQGKLI